MKESSAKIFIPYERAFILVFQYEEWLVGDDPFYLKLWVKLTPSLKKKRQFPINIRS